MVTNKFPIALIVSFFAHLAMALAMSVTSPRPMLVIATPVDIDIVETPASPKRKAPKPYVRRQRILPPAPVESQSESVATIPRQPVAVAAAAPLPVRPSSTGQLTPELIYQKRLEVFLQMNKRYPRLAKQMKKQGRALIRFELKRDGHLVHAEIFQSSTHPRLDQAALTLVQKLNGQLPFPVDLKKDRITFVLPVEYQL